LRVAIMQPSYLPYLGYFDLIKRSDVFVVYDDVQYTKNDWRNRNRIKTPQGEMWLTIPLENTCKRRLNAVWLPEKDQWREKHIKALCMNYARAKRFDGYMDLVEVWIRNGYCRLSDYCHHIAVQAATIFGIDAKYEHSSNLGFTELTKTDRLVAICKSLGADEYLSPNGSKPYLEPRKFEDAGIRLIWQDYEPKVYAQQWGGPFVERLSFVDLLLNHGEEANGFI